MARLVSKEGKNKSYISECQNQKGARDVQRAQSTWVQSLMWLKIGWRRPVTPVL